MRRWPRALLVCLLLAGALLDTAPASLPAHAQQALAARPKTAGQEAPAAGAAEEGLPNIRWEAALPLPMNQTVSQSVGSIFNANWYLFTLPRAGAWQLCFESSLPDQTDGWFIEIYRATENGYEDEAVYGTVFYPTAETLHRVPRVHEQAGSYYVAIGGSNTAAYTLWVDFTPDADTSSSDDGSGSSSGGGETQPPGQDGWEMEPNDSPVQADVLAAGQRMQGVLFTHADVDWFTFELEAPGLLALCFENEVLTSGYTWQAWLYAADGAGPAGTPLFRRVMETALTAHDEQIGLPAGRYYLLVRGDGMPSLEYALQYTLTADAGWEQEPNDTWAQASPLVLGAPSFGHSTTPEDSDWFSFTVAQQGALALNFSALEDGKAIPEGSWVVELYAGGGEKPEPVLLASRQVAARQPAAQAEWLAVAPGDHHIRVYAADSGVLGRAYRLQLELRGFAPVLELRVAQARATIVKGKSMTVGMVVDTEDGSAAPILWESSDPAVATVDGAGKITARKSGKATVTARAENGVYASVRVQVVARTTKLRGLAILGAPKKPEVGRGYTVSARITPASATGVAVRWKSSKPSVVSVDAAGGLTAKKPGKATLTLMAGGKRAHCVVQVVAPVRQLRLPQKSLTLVAGKSATLPAVATTTDGSKAKLAWKSSDTAVATVSQKGKVTAVAPGSATITVKAENGKKAALTVQVVDKAKTLRQVRISGLPAQMTAGDSVAVSAQLSPAAATGIVVRWQSSDSQVLAVDAAGRVTAIAPGQATVTVRAGRKKASLQVVVQG